MNRTCDSMENCVIDNRDKLIKMKRERTRSRFDGAQRIPYNSASYS